MENKMGLTWILGVLAVIFTPLVVYGTLGGEGLLIFSVAAVVGTFPSLISWIFHVKALSWILRTFLSIAGIVIWRWTSDIPFLSELGVGHMGLGVALGLILTPWILDAFGSTDTAQAGQITFRKRRVQKWLHLFIPEGSWYWIPWPLRVHETSEDAAQKAVDKRNATSSPTASAPTTEASNPLPWVIGGGAFILLVILALLFSGGSSDEKKEGAQKKAQQEVSPPSAQQEQQRNVQQQRPKTSRTFEIPQEGLRVWLEEAPATYPKLGEIIIKTPSGRVIHDKPGIDTFRSGSEPFEPAGWYTFLPDTPGSKRKVEIYNRW
ncbi:MAG: hypothetical protein AAB687_02355 [Patescibacteria group bacterium]